MLQAIYDAIDPVAFQIGPLTVRWYGIAYLLSFALCSLVVMRVAKRWKTGMTVDDLMVVLLAVVIGVIVGGRLGYVIIYGNGEYFSRPLEIFNLQGGGMSFHGGLAGVVIGGAVASRVTGIKFLTLADLVAISVPIGLFLGRCANFINGELWGGVTELPWGVVFDGAGSLPRHPSQLYEAFFEGILIFVVLYALSRKRPPLPRGSYLGIFMVLYGIARIGVEFVRQPDVQIGYLYGGWLTMGMALSIPVVVAGVVLLAYALRGKTLRFAHDVGEVGESGGVVGCEDAEAAGPEPVDVADMTETVDPSDPEAGLGDEAADATGSSDPVQSDPSSQI